MNKQQQILIRCQINDLIDRTCSNCFHNTTYENKNEVCEVSECPTLKKLNKLGKDLEKTFYKPKEERKKSVSNVHLQYVECFRKGMEVKEIAALMGTSTRAVYSHLERWYKEDEK